ncbi:MAG: T9SS type A sorting domain-containing protein [Candidatus Cloacimonetes bacterium]|jgi:hypothetical protein|nr:T9SS type A sorting domain-containing protein [Candidatus Cloacimonadota bacterium]MBT6994228.1 T9SS type A sorting domain-containing protein [Candidatus Cloacimonadota bacterium]MBT7470372.1 T9SS type A sorting domain-containing protein [Candidatus Cloacimonadota bacterium]
MKKIGLFLLFLGVVSSIFAVTVTFNCNMNCQIELGNFIAATNIVDVPGSFNGWSGINVLSDDDEDGIYTITIDDSTSSFEVGETIEFKFRINQDWNNAEFPGGSNRTYTILEGENILDYWYNDEEPQTIEVPVTFTLYDESETYQDINIKGTFDEWELHQTYDDGTNGDEVAGDHIWTCVIDTISNGNWEWGALEDDGSEWGIWLVDGENIQFQIDSDGDISGQTHYDIPLPADNLTQDVTVTFQVDMSIIGADTLGVFIAASFNDWSENEVELSDLDEDQIYTVDIIFLEGETSSIEYKFVNGEDWEFIENRNLLIDDTNSTMILEVVYFDNQSSSADNSELPTPNYQLNNYPNPFNVETTISFDISREITKNAKIEIYNIKGQLVKQLAICNYELGINLVNWNAKNQASGIYFYKLTIDDNSVATQKMILLK